MPDKVIFTKIPIRGNKQNLKNYDVHYKGEHWGMLNNAGREKSLLSRIGGYTFTPTGAVIYNGDEGKPWVWKMQWYPDEKLHERLDLRSTFLILFPLRNIQALIRHCAYNNTDMGAHENSLIDVVRDKAEHYRAIELRRIHHDKYIARKKKELKL